MGKRKVRKNTEDFAGDFVAVFIDGFPPTTRVNQYKRKSTERELALRKKLQGELTEEFGYNGIGKRVDGVIRRWSWVRQAQSDSDSWPTSYG